MEKDTRRSRSGEKPGRGFCFAAGKGEAGGKASGVCTGGAMTGECCDPEGYWRGEVRHPSAACGGTSPCRGGFGGLRRGGGGGRWLPDTPAQVCAGGPARFCVVHNRVFLGVGSGRDGEIWNLLKRKKYGIIFGDYPNLKVEENAYIINSINK